MGDNGLQWVKLDDKETMKQRSSGKYLQRVTQATFDKCGGHFYF